MLRLARAVLCWLWTDQGLNYIHALVLVVLFGLIAHLAVRDL